MTANEFKTFKNNFITHVNEIKEKNPYLRIGQITYNEMWEKYPDICNQITASDKDPFYVDDRLDNFWKHMEIILTNKDFI